jgi:hypothetical protein
LRDGRSNTATVETTTARAGSRILSIRFANPGGAFRTREPVGRAPRKVVLAHALSPELVDRVLESRRERHAQHPLARLRSMQHRHGSRSLADLDSIG